MHNIGQCLWQPPSLTCYELPIKAVQDTKCGQFSHHYLFSTWLFKINLSIHVRLVYTPFYFLQLYLNLTLQRFYYFIDHDVTQLYRLFCCNLAFKRASSSRLCSEILKPYSSRPFLFVFSKWNCSVWFTYIFLTK